jgi:hypothetical protein
MVKQPKTHDSIEDIPAQLFNEKKVQSSKQTIKFKAEPIAIHFQWALFLTITCFFIIGPCWALYRTFQLRQLIRDGKFDAAGHLSNRISDTLFLCSIIGAICWLAILFCSVGIIVVGLLIDKNIL